MLDVVEAPSVEVGAVEVGAVEAGAVEVGAVEVAGGADAAVVGVAVVAVVGVAVVTGSAGLVEVVVSVLGGRVVVGPGRADGDGAAVELGWATGAAALDDEPHPASTKPATATAVRTPQDLHARTPPCSHRAVRRPGTPAGLSSKDVAVHVGVP